MTRHHYIFLMIQNDAFAEDASTCPWKMDAFYYLKNDPASVRIALELWNELSTSAREDYQAIRGLFARSQFSNNWDRTFGPLLFYTEGFEMTKEEIEDYVNNLEGIDRSEVRAFFEKHRIRFSKGEF